MNIFSEMAACVAVGYPQFGPKNYSVHLLMHEEEFERFKRFAEETETEGTFRKIRDN